MTSAPKRHRGTRSSASFHGLSADVSVSIRDEIEERIRRFSEESEVYRTPVPGLSVARITAPVPPTSQIDRPRMCMCIRGQRKVSVGETVVFHDENQVLLTAIDRPMAFAIPQASSQKPYTALSIDIDLDIARQMMVHIDVNECNVAPTPSELTAAVTPYSDQRWLTTHHRLPIYIRSVTDVGVSEALTFRSFPSLRNTLRTPS